MIEETHHHRAAPAVERRTQSTALDTAERIGAFAGAAALVGMAARRRSALAIGGATAAALPLVYRGATGHWPAPARMREPGPLDVRVTITVRRSAEDLYRFWRSLEALPRFMRHLEDVEVLDEKLSRWVARSPIGPRVEWEAEITDEEPNRRLAWRSLPGSDVEQRGELVLREGPPDRGTTLTVRMSLEPSRGARRSAAALLRGITERQIRQDLRRFKSLMEADEVPTTEGQPHGERSRFAISSPF